MITINGFVIDIGTEDHQFSSTVTDYPIEDGSVISDHIIEKPLMITIDGIVSDTPLAVIAALRSDNSKPSADAFAELMDMRDAREPVTVETSMGTFTQMALQDVSFPRAAGDGDTLRFRASFKQIGLVTNERTTLRVSVPRAAKKSNRGNKPAKVMTAEEYRELFSNAISGKQEESYLYRLWN